MEHQRTFQTELYEKTLVSLNCYDENKGYRAELGVKVLLAATRFKRFQVDKIDDKASSYLIHGFRDLISISRQ